MQFLFPRSSIIIPRMYERKRKSNDRIRNSILYRKKNPPLKPLKNLKKSVKRKKKSISKHNTIPIICFRQDETKRRAKARSSLPLPTPHPSLETGTAKGVDAALEGRWIRKSGAEAEEKRKKERKKERKSRGERREKKERKKERKKGVGGGKEGRGGKEE